MRRLLFLSVILVCTNLPIASAQNPDGEPGLYGIEPFFRLNSHGDSEIVNDFSQNEWRVGLRALVPGSTILLPYERATTFINVAYGRFSQETALSTTKESRDVWSFGLSVRFWFGKARAKAP